MVVHSDKDGRKKAALSKKVAWALTASLVATPGMLGVHQGTGYPAVHATGEAREIVMYKGQTNELVDLSFIDHRIEVSSDALQLNDDNGVVTLHAQHAGTYTVYVYDLNGQLDSLLDEIRVTVKSHRNEADTDGDGLIDMIDIIAYLKINPEVDMNHDGVFDPIDMEQVLGWIDSKYAEANREPEFNAGDPSTKYWLEFPHSDLDLSNRYEPEPIPLHDYFMDEDGDHLSYQIHSVTSDVYADFKIINNELHYITLDPEDADTHDITVVTIRATDEHGAYRDGQFTIERNMRPRFLDGTNEAVDLGMHYYDGWSVFSPIELNLGDYFTDPYGDELLFHYEFDKDKAEFVTVQVGHHPSELIIDIISGAEMELMLDVTAESSLGNTKTGTFTATIGKKP